MAESIIHILIVFVVLISLVFLSTVGVFHTVLDWGRVGVSVIAYPLTEIFSFLDGVSEAFVSVHSLTRENEILSRQVSQLSAELAVFESLQRENEELRRSLGFEAVSRLDLIPAEVITLDPLSFNQSYVINRGIRHGVGDGDPVIVADRVLVGLVDVAFENTSQVRLITSSGVNINAQSADGSATGIIRGEHGLGLLLDLVSQDESIEIGDRIITSGLGSRLPGDLLIGEVSEIRAQSSELFQKASVVPAADLRNIRTVFIVK